MNQLTIIPQPAELIRQSSDIAGLCREIVVASAVQIGPKKYVPVEAWQAIATAHNCVAGASNVRKVDGGFSAIGEIRRMNDGTLLATAEGFVGDDEPMWAKRPEFARRAMAQTRAISRACRSAFAHVVVLMNAGLSTTPAEEMDSVGEAHTPAPTRQQQRPAAPSRPANAGTGGAVTVVGTKIAKEGTSKTGKPWSLHVIKFSDGTETTTFDAGLYEAAVKFEQTEQPVSYATKPGLKEGNVDLVDISAVEVAAAPELDKDDVPF